MAKLISYSDYARHRGCSPANITKAIAKGKITPINGKIDPEKADIEWNQNSPRLQNRKKNFELAEELAPDSSITSLTRIRAMHEGLRAKKTKLEVDQLEGNLIDAKSVRDAAFNQARLVRDTLLSVPNRLSPVIANETDEHRVHDLIKDEIVSCLRAIDGTQPLQTVS